MGKGFLPPYSEAKILSGTPYLLFCLISILIAADIEGASGEGAARSSLSLWSPIAFWVVAPKPAMRVSPLHKIREIVEQRLYATWAEEH